MAASHSQALKIANKRIGTKPQARTARDTRRQVNACRKVTTRKCAVTTLSHDDVKARILSGNYRQSVIVKGTTVI